MSSSMEQEQLKERFKGWVPKRDQSDVQKAAKENNKMQLVKQEETQEISWKLNEEKIKPNVPDRSNRKRTEKLPRNNNMTVIGDFDKSNSSEIKRKNF